MKNKSPAFALSAFVLALAGHATAASPYARWTNVVGDRAWGDAGNWTSPVLDEFGNPVLGDPPTDEFGNPILDEFGNPLPGEPLFESRVPTSGDKTNIWSAPGPIVSAIADTKELDVGTTLDVVTGGDLLAFNWFIIAYNATDTATLTIDGGDGVSNGEEWCFHGTNPTVGQGHGSPIPEVATTGPGTFTFTHLRPTARDGFTLTYEWTGNLQGPWYHAAASDGSHTVSISVGTPVPDIAGYEKVTVTATASPAAIPGFFARLGVTTD